MKNLPRREWLGWALGLAVVPMPTPALSQEPGQLQAARTFTDIQPWVVPGLEAMARRNWMQAVALLQKAREHLDQDPARRWPFYAYVLPQLGAVLLELNRPGDALDVLQQARKAEERLAAGEGGALMNRMSATLRDNFDHTVLRAELLRQMLSLVDPIGKPRGLPLEALVFDSKLGSHESELPLARCLARLGRAEELAALYRSSLASEPLPSSVKSANEKPPAGLEYRYFIFAVLLAAVGQHDLATQAMDRTLYLNWARTVTTTLKAISLDSHLAVFGVRRHQLSVALDMALNLAPSDEARQRALVARVVESKGLGVRHAVHLRRLLAQGRTPELVRADRLLIQQEDQLKQLGQQELLTDFFRQRIGESLVLNEALPELLALGLGDIFVQGEELIRNARQAQPAAAFIGFLGYARLDAGGQGPGERRYARYVIAGDALQLTDAGNRREIDQQVLAWRNAAAAGANLQDLHPSGAVLRDRLLAGLPEVALRRTRWIIDPDGALSLLPFEALPGVSAPTLLQEHCISYTTGLFGWATPAPLPATGPARIVANPMYPEPVSGAPGASSLPTTARDVRPARLPETQQEAQVVMQTLAAMCYPVQSFTGKQATTQALSFTEPPRFLHIAAHGLMLEPMAEAHIAEDQQHAIEILLPGRQAALALIDEAGNVRLVLARELQRLPLQGTELVVLSACDTGNGRVQAGEGVDSLRRAAEVAGARSTLTSLWPVPSQATAELMRDFYKALATKDKAPAEALRQAKLIQMARHDAPQAWAGFVLAGRG